MISVIKNLLNSLYHSLEWVVYTNDVDDFLILLLLLIYIL